MKILEVEKAKNRAIIWDIDQLGYASIDQIAESDEGWEAAARHVLTSNPNCNAVRTKSPDEHSWRASHTIWYEVPDALTILELADIIS